MLHRPSFATMWANYPADIHGCSMHFPNTCAIRVSESLIKSGWDKDAFKNPLYPGKICPHGYGRGAQDVAAFLAKVWGRRDQGWGSQSGTPSKATSVKGVICFMNLPGFGGQGHIDLWDGSTTKRGAYWDAETTWLWILN